MHFTSQAIHFRIFDHYVAGARRKRGVIFVYEKSSSVHIIFRSRCKVLYASAAIFRGTSQLQNSIASASQKLSYRPLVI